MSPFTTLIDRIERTVPLPRPVKRVLFVIWTLIQDLIRCDLLKQAYAMAYVTLLSLIPSLAAVFCVISFFTPALGKDGILIAKAKDFILRNLATGSGQSAIAYIDEMLSKLNLASIGWTSFAAMLVTLVLLLRQIEGALNRVWLVKKGRSMVTRLVYFWTFLTLGVVAIATVLAATSGFDLDVLLAVDEVEKENVILRGLIAWSGGFAFFFLLYKIVPNCSVSMRAAAIGAAIAALLLHQAGRLYGIFISNFGNYETIYGALAALPLFLMWLWICWLVILLGSVIAWRSEQGFPVDKEEETLDSVQNPVEELRNIQVRALLPLTCVLAIYKHFQDATGKGLSIEQLAKSLKLPLAWVDDALDALESIGYVVRAQEATGALQVEGQMSATFFPAYPAQALKLEKMLGDLAAPAEEWMNHWHHELPIDLPSALRDFTGPKRKEIEKLTLAEAFERLPSLSHSPVMNDA